MPGPFAILALVLAPYVPAGALCAAQHAATGSVEVFINSEDGDLLVEGWTVRVSRNGPSPFSGSAPIDKDRGTALIEGVPPGVWAVTAEHTPSSARIERTVTVAAGATATV